MSVSFDKAFGINKLIFAQGCGLYKKYNNALTILDSAWCTFFTN